jgi:Putative Flp pilus-assembly TadE/G-like
MGIHDMRNPLCLIGRFSRDQGGNIAVIFAIACIPLISAVGCAVDYSLATRVRAKLQSAADAASVAALSKKSPGFVAAAAMVGNGSVTAGVTDANNVFDGDMSGFTGFTNLSRTSTVTKTGVRLNATVDFSADVPVTFMKVLGYQHLTVTGSSSSSSSLPPYLDFYLTLDVSSSMGLPSTPAEAVRMQAVNPDNWVQYRTGCTLACHFAPRNSACTDPPVTSPTNPNSNPATTAAYSQQYNTNGYCMGYVYSRVSQSALTTLINQASTVAVPKQRPGLPTAMLPNLNTNVPTPASVTIPPNSLIAGNASSIAGLSLPAVTSCPTAGTDACIQLRLDAVAYALGQLFPLAVSKQVVVNQFRIGLYPFIRFLNTNYSPLTSSINNSSTTPGTINNAAANLASLLDTNMDANLGSGGTHIDAALNSINTLITSVGTGSSPISTQPYVFLVTDGAQDNQVKGVPNGSWSGSNHATVIDPVNTTVCSQLKNRGIIVSVLYIPYQPINPVNTAFAGNEDTYANNNIASIPASLQGCASPPDAAGSYFYTANSPAEINASLQAMFNHSLQTAHITN